MTNTKQRAIEAFLEAKSRGLCTGPFISSGGSKEITISLGTRPDMDDRDEDDTLIEWAALADVKLAFKDSTKVYSFVDVAPQHGWEPALYRVCQSAIDKHDRELDEKRTKIDELLRSLSQ